MEKVKETRTYQISGYKKDLDTIERFLRHCEYLGSVGASRSLLVRVDGDGFGGITVNKLIIQFGTQRIDNDNYNLEQTKETNSTIVGIYDIG